MATEIALITGASSGIGLELARLFAADGSHLILVARNREKLERLASELRDRHGIEVRVLIQDLAQPGAAQSIFEHTTAAGLSIDVLVNNAGFGAVGRFDRLPLARQIEMIEVNVAALTELTRRFLPALLERRRGGILNVASTAAFQPGPYHAVYFASKAFVMSLTEAIAEELAGTQVTITCLAPGVTATGFGAVAQAENTVLARTGVMEARAVALAGYRGFRRGKLLVIPGLRNRLGVFANRLFPRVAIRKFVKAIQKPRSR